MGAFDILTLACMFYSLTLFVRSYARKRNRLVFDTLERRLKAQVAQTTGKRYAVCRTIKDLSRHVQQVSATRFLSK